MSDHCETVCEIASAVTAGHTTATAVLVSVHAMALLAFFPFAFSWSAVAVMFFLYWVTASLGICLGYHRYLTHRGFALPK